ncbi:hypothetical protein DICVIV_07599 [Dictyocaulus viviparus]|uniref:Uncharacterized protein n=1 Tax=Dictyocaulus viviparus TaxID=29172 RepID=A0A0D8XNX1_DICVI|nr:hypothetical protein DICVIV_07599 [Dictyocaulus viviparus]
MMDGDVQGEDYFIHNTTNITNVWSLGFHHSIVLQYYKCNCLQSIPDVTNFCADDSLLNVINTPEEAAVRRRGNLRGQFLPEAIDDGSSGSSKSSEIRVLTPVDSVQRERQARYCHYILNKGGGRKDISRTNFSRVGDSSRFERNREEEIRNVGTFENLREGLENVAKVIKKSSRRDAFMDESDLQLESDKGNFESSENSF